MTFLLLSGICFATYFVLGYFSNLYHKFGNAAITTFQNIFMNTDYEIIADVNETMAIFITIVIGIVIIFIMLNLVTAIIMSN